MTYASASVFQRHSRTSPVSAQGWPITSVPAPLARGPLPLAKQVLAVTARPGQESADLGGLLHAFRRRGARLALLCLTRGEASPLNATRERLETRRPWELRVAASLLGIDAVTQADLPDGDLIHWPAGELTERVTREIRRYAPDLLLVIDPVTGGPDDDAVARATRAAGEQAGVPALARTVLATRSGWLADLGPEAAPARAAQRAALAAHASQSGVLSPPECRLHAPGRLEAMDAPDRRELLRWL
jgi:N-acetylglucosamine malate deacetylase 2